MFLKPRSRYFSETLIIKTGYEKTTFISFQINRKWFKNQLLYANQETNFEQLSFSQKMIGALGEGIVRMVIESLCFKRGRR